MTKLAVIRASPNVVDGSSASSDLDLKADVCIVGTGAGGAVTAAILAEAGFDVLMIEEGGYYTSNDFTMRERDTTPRLYQEGGTRTTKDLRHLRPSGKSRRRHDRRELDDELSHARRRRSDMA